MDNARTLIKLGAAALALFMGISAQVAFGQDSDPAQAPQAQPTATQPIATAPPSQPSAATLTLRGVACVDLNRDGACSFNEARVPNVIVRGADDAIGVTNHAGEYTIKIPAQSELNITIPSGFTSINGNLRHLQLRMFTAEQLDIALAVDGALPSAKSGAQAPTTVSSILTHLDGIQNQTLVVIALGGLAGIVLLSLLSVSLVSGIKRSYEKALTQHKMALHDQRTKDLSVQLQSADGWQAVAGQLVADALRETVSINADAGVLEIAAKPSPRFTLVTHDGRKVVFTTAPKVMRRLKMIRGGDRVINVSALTATSHIDVGMLWEHILRAHNLWHAAAPSQMQWYVVVRPTGTRSAGEQHLPLLRLPFVQRLAALRGGRG